MVATAVSMLAMVETDREEFLRMAIDHFSELNPSFTPLAEWRERYFSVIFADPHYFLRWIVFEGRKAGFILFGLEDHRFLPRKIGQIYELYVRPEFRRRGLAKACSLAAIAELWTYCPSRIQLEVMEGHSAAARFWSSLGFHKVTERYVLERSTS